MRNQTVFVTLSVCATAIIISAIHAVAGPLNPPPGPVAPTAGPEARIAVNAVNTPGDDDGTPSLFKITQPGSYYLEGNVAGVAGKHGVEIASSGVTLDLNGFELLGVTGSFTGVAVSAPVRNLRIHNGAVRGWGEQGVGAASAFNAVLRDLVASGNTLSGLRIGSGSTVTNSVSSNNEGDGIDVGNGSIVRACVAAFNFEGIRTANGCHVVDNLCDNNNASGVRADGADNRIESNHITDNGIGLNVFGAGNLIIRNSAEGNSVNYQMNTNNKVGTIVSAPNSLTINGSTGGAGVGTTDPWANFSF